ncbi:hypothetical protein DICSQDRAFT_128273 [Dichomitus squalens LYAD-421 SS1]|uniref:Mid2 domain-containing protein n=1 Tax=Dichomitus squalens (strain LYAD-421) TaxID=732165 RepID=R7STL0_DICSQ|nr:uncharacterized protein DICSQDRAFT_128273 [Dichomitus squalens LYAD-421 SS1]EJF59406.1 hypothetical protein DICSQDRAFT_128273 [Dichomitus squalens LYAD-421 SS1]
MSRLSGGFNHLVVAIWPVIFPLSLLFTRATSLLVNVTVDDTFGDPTTGAIPQYLPNDPPGTIGAWHAGNSTETDDWSTSHWTPGVLDLFKIYNQTWHASTPANGPAQVVVSFTGTAVYVYDVVPNMVFETVTTSNMTFAIDGSVLGNFTHSPDPSGEILYNQLVYSNTELEPATHTIVISAEGENHSFILFDYLIYTTESSDETPSRSSSQTSSSSSSTASSTVFVTTTVSPSSRVPLGAVLGAVFGGVVLLLATLIGAYFLLRRHSKPHSSSTSARAYPTRTNGSDRTEDGADSQSSTIAFATAPAGALMTQTQSTDSPVSQGASSFASPEPSKRQVVISRRIQTLQRELSMLSASSPSIRSGDTGEGTETVVRALETEVAALRRELAGFSSQLHGDRRTTEAPPGYQE